MALSLAPYGIRVNAIGPGSIMTDMLASVASDKAARDRVLSRTPLGRIGDPSEIASIAAFLASDDASYVTGQTIYADGGRLPLNYTVPVTTSTLVHLLRGVRLPSDDASAAGSLRAAYRNRRPRFAMRPAARRVEAPGPPPTMTPRMISASAGEDIRILPLQRVVVAPGVWLRIAAGDLNSQEGSAEACAVGKAGENAPAPQARHEVAHFHSHWRDRNRHAPSCAAELAARKRWCSMIPIATVYRRRPESP